MPLFPRRRALAVLAAVSLAAGAGVSATARRPTPEPVARILAWGLDARYLGRDGVRMQQGATDCGVAALAMVLEHHRRDPRLEAERSEVLGRGEGLSLLEMQSIAAARGLATSGWRLDAAALARAPLPAVAHLTDHYVVVDAVAADGTVLVRDPALGRVALTGARFAELWTGHVLLVDPAAR